MCTMSLFLRIASLSLAIFAFPFHSIFEVMHASAEIVFCSDIPRLHGRFHRRPITRALLRRLPQPDVEQPQPSLVHLQHDALQRTLSGGDVRTPSSPGRAATAAAARVPSPQRRQGQAGPRGWVGQRQGWALPAVEPRTHLPRRAVPLEPKQQTAAYV